MSDYRLRTLPLNQENCDDCYIFSNEEHARQWLAQAFVSDDRYAIEIGKAERTAC